jgi:hypothetical protein
MEKEDSRKNRFWEKVEILEEHECWEWDAATQSSGYGAFAYTPNKTITAHRYSWAIHHNKGKLPSADMHVMHLCDHKICVNPYHLQLGTAEENNKDGRDRGRIPSIETLVGRPSTKKLCRHGHRRTPENTIFKDGYPLCKTCVTNSNKASKARKKTQNTQSPPPSLRLSRRKGRRENQGLTI